MAFEPTDEQRLIVEAARTTSDNLIINALAGAAKTTTLELIGKALPTTPILYVVFNKRNADEATKRVPSNMKPSTINSVGHRAWAAFTGRRLVVETKKSYDLLKAVTDALDRTRRREVYDQFAEILKAVSTAKLQGYVPEGKFPQARRLITKEDFYGNLEDEVPDWIVERVLFESIQAAFNGLVDFDDQIYMPALFGGTFPRFPLVLVDEAQDLSSINHALLDRLVTARIIAVGDPFQSIYAFRGADTASMPRLKSRWNMRELTLSTSFRCARAVVALARSRAPNMQWAPWAPEGSVAFATEWSASDIPDGAAIICRLNAPLYKCALALLQRGRGVKLVGTDLGPSLIRALRKLGPETMEQPDVLKAIDQWQAENMAKSRKKASFVDKAECLRVFASFGPSLRAAIAYAEHLFAQSGPIQLLSGHKAKGLEWETVYHLDPWRIPSEWALTETEQEQELNVGYVITTRAKLSLIHVNLRDLEANAAPQEEEVL
jgi:DNA helicase-2/ATP-dependent DNA helicase PcrA